MIAMGEEGEVSAVECAQGLYDCLKEKGFSEEILNNAHQLVKKIQDQSKELANVEEVDEQEDMADGEDAGEDMPDYSKMSKDEMSNDLKKKGIITITIGHIKK